MTELLRLHSNFEVRATDENAGKRSVTFVASTSAIDSYGEILVQDWNLERFQKNPVVLYGHDSYSLPIGFASDVKVDDSGRLVATLNFVDAKANPLAEQVWEGIKQGSLRAVSVGFVSHGKPAALSLDGGDKHVIALSGNELFEISVVPIPANPEAVTLGVRSFINRTLDAGKDSDMKALALALGLSADASEEVISKRATELRECSVELLAATGKTSVGEALGAVTAALEGVKTVSAELASLKAAAESREKEDLIRAGEVAKKITPAKAIQLRDKPIDFVRGYIEMQEPIPALAENHEEPAHSTSELKHDGRTWSELSFDARHALHNSNPDLYAAMRDAAGA